MTRRAITLVMAHFMNCGMLREHQRIWSAYPLDLAASLHVIVIDDCSPKGHRPSHKMADVERLASVRLFRLLVKARWNWLACRNLGVDRATTEWVLLTDIDHALPVETLTTLTTMDLDRDCVYRLARVDAPRLWPYRLSECPPYKVHPNTWIMTREMYDRVGGYDETLSGLYGTDAEFRERVQSSARSVVMLPDVMVRYPRTVLPDASTTIYTRKNDPVNDAELRRRREERSQMAGWRPRRLTFPYEEIVNPRVEAAC